MARVAALFAVVVVSGCFGTIVHLERNAPASIDVLVPPPKEMDPGGRVRPRDPGERFVSVGPEATVGTALWGGEWTVVSAAQVSAIYGERRTSHVSDDILLGDRLVLPEWSAGGAIAWDVLPAGQADRRLALTGRFSSEGLGVEAGWAVEPSGGAHSAILGTYLIGGARFVFVRALFGFERKWGFETGIAIDYALTWVWSR